MKHISRKPRLGGGGHSWGWQPNPEPWIFFATNKQSRRDVWAAATAGAGRQEFPKMLKFDGAVVPTPATRNVDTTRGVSTSLLFPREAASKLADPVFGDIPRPLLRDIPDIISHPRQSHCYTTDCISCHSETTRRNDPRLKAGIAAGDGKFRYTPPAGISGVDEAVLPQTKWNVRNLGWFPASAPAAATISDSDGE